MSDHHGPDADADRAQSLAPVGEDVVETAARAYDPVGWAWYDKAYTHHPAKPIFRERAFSQMRAAIAAMPPPPEREALRITRAVVEEAASGFNQLQRYYDAADAER